MLPLAISFLLYRCFVPWHRAVREWVLDFVLVVSVYSLVTTHTRSARLTTADTIHHAFHIARDALKLMGATVLPFGGSGWVGVGVAGVVIAALLSSCRGCRRRSDETRAAPLALGHCAGKRFRGCCLRHICAGLAIYTPLAPGLQNRTNALSAPLLIAIAICARCTIRPVGLPASPQRATLRGLDSRGLRAGDWRLLSRGHSPGCGHLEGGIRPWRAGAQPDQAPHTETPARKHRRLLREPAYEAPGPPFGPRPGTWMARWRCATTTSSSGAVSGVPGTVIRCGPGLAGPFNELYRDWFRRPTRGPTASSFCSRPTAIGRCRGTKRSVYA